MNAVARRVPASSLAGWAFGLLILAIAFANLLLVHPVPAVAYVVVSLVYFPAAEGWLRRRTGVAVPAFAKVALGITVVWFTLGVSDLGDMID